ncbi:protein kinase domain-containing protein [Leptolyngbya sp. NIES-2104]|uniref:protein kinase domain-containing protein n=1 Tax=Leptolyngbya sp. NIES-2104 TaxID=1552121 RepID=UPI0006EC5C04|nr:protein kinase [Leptolyngbya sp. NIES-2104]GAP94460.1 serine/threonine kinase [Leptolyngbya sp. NIES-2104]
MKPEIAPGTIIHKRYRIHSVLGQGGLGRTYLAFDIERFEERWVLKEFAPNGISLQSLPKARELFYREAKILYQIKHPQIPEFSAFFEEQERLFLVQQFIEGETYAKMLYQRLAHNQVFSEAEVIQLLKALLPVLGTVHAQGILHRDVSIDNMMLSHGMPVLIDFGVGTQAALNQVPTSFVGKHGYAPFEQLSEGRCSPSSDLYALAVSAIVLLSGRQPSHLLAAMNGHAAWRSSITVSDTFAQILARMLAFLPEERYQSADAVLDALQSIKVPSTNLSTHSEFPINAEVFTSMPDLPGGAMATRPLHFIWICDCSESMAIDGKIQALNTAIEEVIPHMKAAADDNPNAQVLLRAIRFSSGAEWIIPEPTPIESFRWNPLTAKGDTDLAAALHQVAEQLKAPPMNTRALPPVLVLISDGQPTDDYIAGLNALFDQFWGRKAIRVAIAIGRDADYEVLQQFIGHSNLKPLRANNPEALVRQIKWASTAVLKAASAPASFAKDGSLNSLPIPLSNPSPVLSGMYHDRW